MEGIVGNFANFMSWLTVHDQLAYVVLFFGSYFETLIGPSFFIPGEIFLIAGSVLAGAGVLKILYVSIALYAGALLGDNSSYYVGHRASKAIFKEGRKVFSMKNYRKGEAFFEKYGNKAIFFARIMGPLSWIMPFLAGVYRIPYRTFALYNTPGIVVGVGEFLVIGYFFGDQYQRVLKVVQHYFVFALLLVILFFAVRWTWDYRFNRPKRRALEEESE